MNRVKILLAVLTIAGFEAQAQINVLNAKTPAEIGQKSEQQRLLENDNPLPYGYVNEERDVLYSKHVWEIIDLDQRVNFPLYFPIEDNLGAERRSLFNVLIAAIENEEITEVYGDSYFRTKKTLEEVKQSFFYKEMNDYGKDVANQYQGSTEEELLAQGILTDEHYSTSYVTGADVQQYAIRGYWYFDARQGELKYRLLGICPKAIPALDKLRDGDKGEPIELFWVYFPDARQTLHKALAFNEKNSASPFNFDHLLNSRRFNATIYMVDNVYGDRKIEQYLKDNAQFQLLEAQRLKEEIRNFEQDMWSY